MNSRNTILGVIALVCLPALAFAESLRVKEIRVKQEAELPRHVESLNKTCGAKIAVELKWDNFQDADSGKSLVGYCDNALSGIERVCGSAPGKEAVNEKIHKVVCGVGDSRAVALSEGTLNFTVQWTAGNDADFVQEYLRSNL